MLGLVLGLGAIFSDGFISVLLISLLGLANALVFPAIWPIGIAGLGRFTKIGVSFLIMAIAGGAILPLIYGFWTDLLDPKQAYWLVIENVYYKGNSILSDFLPTQNRNTPLCLLPG